MQEKYRLPAEWETQSGVLITWPHQHSDWQSRLSQIETFFVSLAKAITQREKLLVVAYDESHKQHIQNHLVKENINLDAFVIYIAPTNDTWTRDYGPIILANSHKTKCLDFVFNAWGNKFSSELDNLLVSKLVEDEVLSVSDYEKFPIVLEGGSIDSNGHGVLLTTKQCLLNKNRNPQLSEDEITQVLKKQLNVKHILWLSEGMIIGDDTDSHIDMLARFTAENTIVYSSCNDETDPHFKPLNRLANEIKALKSLNGEPYSLHELPIPAAIFDDEGNRLPASYANFLIINNAVLLPIYQDPHDETAINVLQSCFPEREIIPLDARAAIIQGGSLHCLTMQLVDGVLN